MLLVTVFFSFALIVCPNVLLSDNDSCSLQDLIQEETRDCGCKKKSRKKTRMGTEEDINEERCGICVPQDQLQPQNQSQDESDATKCGCGRPKKSVDLDCGCGRPKKDPSLDCGCGKPKKSITLDCCICVPSPAQQDQSQDSEEETKKIHTSEVLEGIANTCAHAGIVAGAPDKKVQKQAVCNLVGSIFHLAAQITKKEDKNPEIHNRSIKTITHQILAYTSQEHVRSQLFTNKPYLIILNSLKNPAERNELIDQLINNPEDCREFLEELFTTVKEYLQLHQTNLYEELDHAFTALIEQNNAIQRSPETQKDVSIRNIEVCNDSGTVVQVTFHVEQ